MNSTNPFTSEQREKLREIVEGYGGSLDGFEKLPPDSYEQQLAGHSLDQLDALYGLILKPGQSLEGIADQCPPWPAGKFKGRTPAGRTLYKVFNRFQAERTLVGLTEASGFIKKLKEQVSGLPISEDNTVVDLVCTLVGQELVKEKMEGVGITQNLRALDRLLKRADQKRDERKVCILEKKAEAFDRAQAALAEAKESKGGLTEETLERIERELNLL